MHKSHQETKTEPKVSTTEQTAQTPAVTQREMDLRQRRVISKLTDEAAFSEPQDSEEEQLCKSCSDFSHSCVYPQHLRAPSIPNIPLHSAQVNTWNSCPNRVVPCGLSPAASVRTPAGPGFPISLQQHPLVQVHGRATNQ